MSWHAALSSICCSCKCSKLPSSCQYGLMFSKSFHQKYGEFYPHTGNLERCRHHLANQTTDRMRQRQISTTNYQSQHGRQGRESSSLCSEKPLWQTTDPRNEDLQMTVVLGIPMSGVFGKKSTTMDIVVADRGASDARQWWEWDSNFEAGLFIVTTNNSQGYGERGR